MTLAQAWYKLSWRKLLVPARAALARKVLVVGCWSQGDRCNVDTYVEISKNLTEHRDLTRQRDVLRDLTIRYDPSCQNRKKLNIRYHATCTRHFTLLIFYFVYAYCISCFHCETTCWELLGGLPTVGRSKRFHLLIGLEQGGY